MDAPEIKYARSTHGVAVAWATAGSGRDVLVVPAVPFCHAELNWNGAFPHRHLAAGFRTVWYDARGTGLSGRTAADFSLDAMTRDLESVVAESGINAGTLVAYGDGPIIAMAFAARHPEIVSNLVLVSPWASTSGWWGSKRAEFYRQAMDTDWHLFTETVARVNLRLAEPLASNYAAYLRACVNPEIAQLYWKADIDWNVEDLLPLITSRTLVAVRADRAAGDREPALHVARSIPSADLVSTNIDFGSYGPALARLVADFIGESVAIEQRGAHSAFRTILFTDVVSSTPLLTQLRDQRMREVMRDHDAVMTAAVTGHGGRVVKTIGDAFMAEFAVPSAAIEAAIEAQRQIREKFAASDVPVRLRIGINAGEPIEEDGDLHGASVVIAKRLESAADSNGILVSDVVKQMVTGKDFDFEDRGPVELKGFDEPVRAWAVRWE
jgi:class 3 adenylate cyclase